jgi:hypothetical protein
MKALFISKIVVKHGLIRARGRGNLVGASASHSFGREMLLGRRQNSAGRRGVLHFFASARHT